MLVSLSAKRKLAGPSRSPRTNPSLARDKTPERYPGYPGAVRLAEVASECGYHEIMQKPADVFEIVRTVGLALPDVEATTKYDGSPVLKLGGCFMAGLATHRSAEPDTLVVRVGFEDRKLLIEDAPET